MQKIKGDDKRKKTLGRVNGKEKDSLWLRREEKVEEKEMTLGELMGLYVEEVKRNIGDK